MSLKRSHASGRSSFGSGGDAGAKVDRQELYDELKRLAASGEPFSPVDVALSIGAGEPQMSKALLGLAAEGYLEKAEVGKYRATPITELGQADFLRAFARASKADSTRQRDLSDITRLKQNNDTMRQRLLTAIAERDHYLAALKKHGIDPGPAPLPAAVSTALSSESSGSSGSSGSSASLVSAARLDEGAPGPAALAVPSPPSEAPPSGPGDAGGHGGQRDLEPSGEPHHGG